MTFYSWGANSHGQLGQGDVSEACCLPVEVSIPNLDPANICSVVGGGGHTLVLDHSGRVYSSGWNSKGQLGLLEDEVWTFQPVESLLGHQITQIACGWDSSLAVTSNGSLLVWGSNSYGQLGLPKQKFRWTNVPKVATISKVKQASFGLRHIAAVTMTGRVFVSGSGNKGQLGILDCNACPMTELDVFTEVPGLVHILTVSCGQHHCIALSEDNKIYVWGSNKFGQLGLDPAVHPVVNVPHELSLKEFEIEGNPSAVFAGWTHTVLTTDKGELINWGRNTYGQLGSIDRVVSWSPAPVHGIERIRQIAVGSEHSIILTETDQILSWGWNEHGNCGNGRQDNILEPSLAGIKKKGKATLIGSGACHSFAVLKSKRTL